MWFALDDATLGNGCLWYLPGTHLLGDYTLVKIGSNMVDLFKAYPEWKTIKAVPTPCSAGSVVIHNGMVAHAAGANMTPKPRRAMTSVYYPDGEVYVGHPDTLPEAYYRNLKAGDKLNDDSYVPLVWHRDKYG
jgi:ectoine hydroxylase-related dioxygenase (phytanoyl-CoA dioxygenase family)